MTTDTSNYKIVEISVGNWAISYSDGSLESGYKSFDSAMEVAQSLSTVSSVISDEPRNLSEAIIRAQSARDSYRSFLTNNPMASQEAIDAKAGAIAAADAYVSEYQMQSEAVRKANESMINGDVERERNTYMANLNNADSQRRTAISNAVDVKNNPSSTTDQISAAENQAYQAELFYQSQLQEVQNKNKSNELVGSYDNTLYSGGGADYVNFGSQFLSSSASISDATSGSFDIIRSTVDNNLGSISRSVTGNSNDVNSSGNVSGSSSTIYNTSTGVTKVNSTSDPRVKLSPKPSIRSSMLTGVLEPLASTGGLVFPYTPQISVSGTAGYTTLDTAHANQNWHIYNNTPSIELQISGLFTAQNDEEAKYTLACIHFLRVLTKMHFGDSDNNKGLPPPQVVLDGYGTYMFNGLSVIVKNYNVDLPNTVDYVSVASGDGISSIPAVTTLTVQLVVQQTPKKAREFNWDNFASGSLMQQKGWL